MKHWWIILGLAVLILSAGIARRVAADTPAALSLDLQVKAKDHIIASLTSQWKACESNLASVQQGQAVLAQRAALVEEFRKALGAEPRAIFNWDALAFDPPK